MPFVPLASGVATNVPIGAMVGPGGVPRRPDTRVLVERAASDHVDQPVGSGGVRRCAPFFAGAP